MSQPVLEAFLQGCADYDGEQPSQELRQVTGAFLAHAKNDAQILTHAVESLTRLPPAGAAWLGITMGAAVEDGTNPELTAPAIVDLFVAWLSTFPVVEPDDDSMDDWEPTPEQIAFLNAFPELCRGIVAHLARMAEYRAQLAKNDSLMDRLDALNGLNPGISWVREALLRRSGTLIVLHPTSGKGFRLRYQNVAVCFHLFSLLQTALGERMPGGRPPDAKIAAAARGQDSDDDVTDEAWWHYGDPRSKTAELDGSIWGEASVRAIPSIDGVQFMLLWPPIVESRCWMTNFGPHLQALPSDVMVEEELSAEQSRAWLQTLGISAS